MLSISIRSLKSDLGRREARNAEQIGDYGIKGEF
jgi:hypothetical protein